MFQNDVDEMLPRCPILTVKLILVPLKSVSSASVVVLNVQRGQVIDQVVATG